MTNIRDSRFSFWQSPREKDFRDVAHTPFPGHLGPESAVGAVREPAHLRLVKASE